MEPTAQNSSLSWLFFSALNVLGNTFLLVLLGLGAKRITPPYHNIIFAMGIGLVLLAIIMCMMSKSPYTTLAPPDQFWKGVLGSMIFGGMVVCTMLYAANTAPNPMYPVIFSHIATPLALIALVWIHQAWPELIPGGVEIKPQHILGGLVIFFGIIIFKISKSDINQAVHYGKKATTYVGALFF